MGFLKLIPGGWIVWVLIAAVVGGVAAYGGYALRGSIDAPIIAKAQVAQAQAEADVQRERTDLSEQQKQVALDAQAASEKAIATQTALQAQVSNLTAKLTQTEKARAAATAAHLDALARIPREQQATLSPGVKQYLRDVMREQQAIRANPTPAPDRRPDPVPVPSRAARIP